MTEVTIIGGPPGAGKTTVAYVLSMGSERGVHVDADKFLGFIRSGYILPWLPEAQSQNEVAARAAARAAAIYVAGGYDVVLDGFIRPWSLRIYLDELLDVAVRVHFVMLLPDLETVVRRGVEREDTHGVPELVLREAYPRFVEDGFASHRLDSSGLSIEETVDVLVRERATGRFELSEVRA